MIIKGASRSSVSFWSKHLLRTDHNEQVEVIETAIWHEQPAQAVAETLQHFQSLTRLTEKGQKGLYCAHIDPGGQYDMTSDQWQASLSILEHELGLSGQPRLVVKHLKDDREHLHVVWQRTQEVEAGKFTLISDSHNYKHHELAARQMEHVFEHEPVRGVFTGRERDPETGRCLDERPVAKLHHHEWQQAERIQAKQPGKDPAAIKAEIANLWQVAGSGQAFESSLTHAGYTLAQGDKKSIHMVMDADGEAYDLRRSLAGVKKKDLEARLLHAPADTLPKVSQVRAQQDHERGWFERADRQAGLQWVSVEATRETTQVVAHQETERQCDEQARDPLNAWEQMAERDADLSSHAETAKQDHLVQAQAMEAMRHHDEQARQAARAAARREAFQDHLSHMRRQQPHQTEGHDQAVPTQGEPLGVGLEKPTNPPKPGALTRLLQRMRQAWQRMRQQDDHLQGLEAQAQRNHDLERRALADTAERTAWANEMEAARTERADPAATVRHADRVRQRDGDRPEAPRQPDRVPGRTQPVNPSPETPPPSPQQQREDRIAQGIALHRERLEDACTALEQQTGQPHHGIEVGPVEGRLIDQVHFQWRPFARLEQAPGYAVVPWHPEMANYIGQEVRLQLNAAGTFVRTIEAVPGVAKPPVPREMTAEPGRETRQPLPPKEPPAPDPAPDPTPTLSREARLEPQLPDDLPSLESMWKREVDRRFDTVQHRAQRVAGKARLQLQCHQEQRRQHETDEPKMPRGLLAPFRQKRYEQDLKAWQARDKKLHWRWLQLNQRVKEVADYGRKGLAFYPSKGEQLAQKQLRAERPELARKRDQAREQAHQKYVERLKQEPGRRSERERGAQGIER